MTHCASAVSNSIYTQGLNDKFTFRQGICNFLVLLHLMSSELNEMVHVGIQEAPVVEL